MPTSRSPRSARSTSCSPSDSKSGLRSSLNLFSSSSVPRSGPERHARELLLQTRERLGLALVADGVLARLLAVAAEDRERQRAQARGRDLLLALLATAVVA